MSNKLYFMNNGMFDLRGMLTMGLSAKKKDGAIGFFGTGFKYAVAIILRNLGTIKVLTTGQDGMTYTYEFFSQKESFRDSDVDIVYIRDHATGDIIHANFTTRMGINWEPWMAFRELYCNCIDEDGVISTSSNGSFETIIEVDCIKTLQAFESKDDYILPEMEPLHVGKQCDIYERKLPFIYYKGIAVLRSDESAFTYNIKSHLDLTEDRTVKYDWYAHEAIRNEIQATNCIKVVEVVVQSDCRERGYSFDLDKPVSDAFVATCERLQNSDKGISEQARALLKKKVIKDRKFPEFNLSDVQQQMVDKAKSFLLNLDMRIDQFPIKYVNGLGDGVMGRALDGIIYISELPFNMGTKQLASTLMEEWVHLKTGCYDFDRQMQNWLFDKILTLGENINKQPL